jgi:hypothetical protein
MIPLKKADKNAKAPEKEVKPPAWKSKPKPQPQKNVKNPTNYAGKATDTPAHELDSLLPPVKVALKSSAKGKEGETLKDKAAMHARDILEKKRT